MLKIIFTAIIFFTSAIAAVSQTREELEKQRQELKKEIEETEKQLKNNKVQTKESLLTLKLINKKVNLQDRVIDNINKDLRVLNNNLFNIQRDIYRYDKLLDTLKLEYAKSMVYAYKNRSNYDFLNFIFSAANFNDAIKRLTYLKSYRNYREMQGENILRTQELRRKKREELGGTKQAKNQTLQTQNKEMQALENEQKEKDRVLSELKKQGKQLNSQMAAKQKQMQKVSNAIASAIKKAQEAARKAALAKAAEEEKARKQAANLAKNNATSPDNSSTTSTTKSISTPVKVKTAAAKPESILLNAGNTALNTSFEKNRGSLPWPVDRGVVLMHYGPNTLPSGSKITVTSTTIAADIGTPVKAVFNGTVSTVQSIEDMQVVIIQHGRYFTTYSNLSGVNVSRGQEITTGQTIGKVAANFDGVGAIDFYMSNESSNFDPERWLRNR